jgi:hypothetical protein
MIQEEQRSVLVQNWPDNCLFRIKSPGPGCGVPAENKPDRIFKYVWHLFLDGQFFDDDQPAFGITDKSISSRYISQDAIAGSAL